MFSKENGGKIVSSSVFFYKPDNDSFLLIKEMRKKTPQSMYKEVMSHMFGGKVEKDDVTPLYTAIREFMEEIGANDKNKIDNLYNDIIKLSSIPRKDICVSVRNSLYNSCYIININLLSFHVQQYINNLISKRPASESVKDVFYHPRSSKLENSTSLLVTIFNELPSSEFLNY